MKRSQRDTSLPLPDFEKPPVNEVVFGVQFEPIKEFKAPHFGVFWEKLGRDIYPDYQEVNPLTHITEEDQGTKQKLSFINDGLPPLPRVFLVNPTGHELVQIQQDRFLRNWRKMAPEEPYPRYETLLPKFENSLEDFKQFISDEFKGKQLNIDQYELTYVNHIYMNGEELNQKKLSKYFKFYSTKETCSFLPIPEVVGWNNVYKLPNDLGRLHVTLSQAYDSEGKSLFVLNLTARGIDEQEDLKSWLKVAHEWIVRGFADITGEQAQRDIWGVK